MNLSPFLRVPLLDDEDLVREILLRLPPQPSSLPHASLVCKHWRNIFSDPKFLPRFRKHHRTLPLLGYFDIGRGQAPVFTPVLDPPDRIPASRFQLPQNLASRWGLARFALPLNLAGQSSWRDLRGISFIGCRHGVALLLDRTRHEAILWDPLTGHQRHVAFPPSIQDYILQNAAAMVCAAGSDKHHVHGDCNFSPFKLVLVCHDSRQTRAFACVYESESGVWGDVISTATTYVISMSRPSILVGNALCWLLSGVNILEFVFQRQTLAVIKGPVGDHDSHCLSFQHLRREDNGLGLAVVPISRQSIQLWARKSNIDGVNSWVLHQTVPLAEFSSRPWRVRNLLLMSGYDEDTNVLFLSSDSHDFMLQLNSMQFKYIGQREFMSLTTYYPYTNFYATVRDVTGGDDEAENVST